MQHDFTDKLEYSSYSDDESLRSFVDLTIKISTQSAFALHFDLVFYSEDSGLSLPSAAQQYSNFVGQAQFRFRGEFRVVRMTNSI